MESERTHRSRILALNFKPQPILLSCEKCYFYIWRQWKIHEKTLSLCIKCWGKSNEHPNRMMKMHPVPYVWMAFMSHSTVIVELKRRATPFRSTNKTTFRYFISGFYYLSLFESIVHLKRTSSDFVDQTKTFLHHFLGSLCFPRFSADVFRFDFTDRVSISNDWLV